MSKQRNYILVYINGERKEIRGQQAFLNLAEYLRSELQLTGTKIVCAEGDCGACTVLVAAVKSESNEFEYRPINACIALMHSLDCSHIISIEGLNKIHPNKLHPIQQSMLECHGSQCGFCTPGFVVAAAGMLEKTVNLNEKRVRNHLTGNLCRCTGYQQIITGIGSTNTSDYKTVKAHYHKQSIHKELLTAAQIPVVISHGENSFIAPVNIGNTINHLQDQQNSSRPTQIFAAATDLGVQINKAQLAQQNALSLHLITELYKYTLTDQHSSIGARITLTELRHLIKEKHPEFSHFLNIFASPQIKNNATLVGNIANGSPIGDTLPFLMAMDALIVIEGSKGIRKCNINNFYLGYRKMDLAATEIITHVEIPHKPDNTQLKLYKVSQRRDLDISCVSSAFKVQFDQDNNLVDIAIAFGGVAATVCRLTAIEDKLKGLSKEEFFNQDISNKIATSISTSLSPMSDVRGSEGFRKTLLENLYRKFIHELKAEEKVGSADEI